MASFESLSDFELRKKLLEHGYDIPVSGNRDFVIKKLYRLTSDNPKDKVKGGRKSLPVSRPQPTSNNNAAGGGNTTKNSRLSLNETGGLRQRSSSKEPTVPVEQPIQRSPGRRSMGATDVSRATSKPKVSNTTTNQPPARNLNQRRSLPAQPQNYSTRLNQVVEIDDDDDEKEAEESSEEDEDSIIEDIEEDEGIVDEEEVIPYLPSRSAALTTRYSSTPQFSPNKRSLSSASTNSSTTSSKYESYLKYFKSPETRREGDPFLSINRSNSPGTPYSTTATAGSPSFNRSYNSCNSMMTDDCSADEEEEEDFQNKNKSSRSKLNPLNWVRNIKDWLTTSSAQLKDDNNDLRPGAAERQTDKSYYYPSGERTSFSSSPPATPSTNYGTPGRYSNSPTTSSSSSSSTSSSGLNGHWNAGGGGPGTAGLVNRLYSPAVPPAMAAGRQAGFKAFFSSRGERNGYGCGNVTNGGVTSGWSDSIFISKMIVLFILAFFLIIGAMYYHKSTMSNGGIGGAVLDATFIAEGGVIQADPRQKMEVKRQIASPSKPPKTPADWARLKLPICGMSGLSPDEPCVDKNYIRNSRDFLLALKAELAQRASWKGCGSEVDDVISLNSAKQLGNRLVDIKKSDLDEVFKGVLTLVTLNPDYGLKIEVPGSDEEITSKNVSNLDSNIATITAIGDTPNFMCILWAGFASFILNSFYLAIVAVVGYCTYKGIMYFQTRKKREEHEMYELIEKVLKLLNDRYELSQLDSDSKPFEAVNHIRDELIPLRDRKRKGALWFKVENHISTNESRVREEIQHISGEEYRVWRWLPVASPLSISKKRLSTGTTTSVSPSGLPSVARTLYPSLDEIAEDNETNGPGGSPWQGQAFEVIAGSPNALSNIPSTCLKIRQMFDQNKGQDELRENRIERAILEKCGQARILHIGIEPSSTDGCVYVRCMSKEDARAAYSSLHGWWFDGHLLSVKFLREERYFERFYGSKNITNPMSLSLLPPLSPLQNNQPLTGQQNYANSINIRSGGQFFDQVSGQGGGFSSGPGTSSSGRQYSVGY